MSRDNELDELLKPFTKVEAKKSELLRWQEAVRREIKRDSNKRLAWAFQLVAAVLVGVIAGAAAMKLIEKPNSNLIAEVSFDDDATFEHAHTNLDQTF